VALLATPTAAFAAGGRTLGEVFLALLVFSAVVVFVWSVFFFLPVRQYLLRTRARRRRLLLLTLGVVALSLAAASIAIGKTTIGSGVVIREIEPQRYWQLVYLQLGSGCILIVLGLLNRR
jgi:hypothetical protein